MKQRPSISKFLNVEIKKFASKPKARAELIAIAPRSESKPDGFVLHEDFGRYEELLGDLRSNEELSSKAGATCFVRFAGKNGGEHLLVVGLGTDRDGVNTLGAFERYRRLGAIACAKFSAERVSDAVVHLDSFFMSEAQLDVDAESAAAAFVEGFGMAAYRFEKYNTTKKPKKADDKFELTLTSSQSGRLRAFSDGASQALAVLQGLEICRDLGNEPSNHLPPAKLAKEAETFAKRLGLKAKILDERVIKREGMGMLWGVGQGSVNPPRLIQLEYTPRKMNSKTKTIAFVGKGITFDSGGISIKPAARMEDMKHDMCGAAAVLGAIAACAALGVQTRVIAIVAAAENMPDGGAIQPGNILTARNGKTVEIINTDAEGRLVLGDALDYVQDMKPDYVIDLATLTGAVVVTLGRGAAGLMGNDPEFTRLVQKAAKESGERVWELPLYDEYFDDLKSEYADMRNSGDTPNHGTAKAAMFLQKFIRKGTKWVHLDIAAMAYGNPTIPYNPKKSSTGFGVRLLVDLAKSLAN